LRFTSPRRHGLDRLVVHTVTSAGTPPLHQALDYVRGELREQSPLSRRERGRGGEAGRPPATAELGRRIGRRGFEWGVSDGS